MDCVLTRNMLGISVRMRRAETVYELFSSIIFDFFRVKVQKNALFIVLLLNLLRKSRLWIICRT